MNNLTSWTYDTSFNLYPATERNALNQTRSFATSFPCGLRSQEIDLNGLQTNSTYDVFCRKIREERPATGFYEATAYLSFGNPAEQRVETSRPHPDGGAPVTTSEFFDGLGRIWRNGATGPAAGVFIETLRSFDARGNVASEMLPRYTGAVPLNTSFRYDGLDRLAVQTNPDGTTRSFVHDIDRRASAGGSIPV